MSLDLRLRVKTAAHHEAGHAVTAIKLGLRFSFVCVAGGYGKVEPFRGADGVPMPWPATLENAAFAFAGPLAEHRYSKKSWGSLMFKGAQRDLEQVEQMRLSKDQRQAAFAMAQQLVSGYWQAIQAVATALHQHGVLGENQVIQIINQLQHRPA